MTDGQPEANPAHEAGPEGGQSGSAAPPEQQGGAWHEHLPDDLKGLVEQRKWGSVEDALRSYASLEKLRGVPEEKLVRLPGEDDDPSRWDEVWSRLGRPETPDGYEVELPDGADKTRFDTIAKKAHEVGVTNAQLRALVAADSDYLQSATAEVGEAQQAKVAEEHDALKKEWGAAFDKNLDVARRAVRIVGLSEEAIDAMENAVGYKQVMEAMHNIGVKIGEDSFVGAGSSSAGFDALSPAAARHEIDTLSSDPEFRKKLTTGDKAAAAKWDRLHKYAFGGAA